MVTRRFQDDRSFGVASWRNFSGSFQNRIRKKTMVKGLESLVLRLIQSAHSFV